MTWPVPAEPADAAVGSQSDQHCLSLAERSPLGWGTGLGLSLLRFPCRRTLTGPDPDEPAPPLMWEEHPCHWVAAEVR